MQRTLLNSKNRITLLSALLIALAFGAKWIAGSDTIFTTALIVASIIGVAPITVQAYQALRVRVISIDVLVTIAVVGAFLIQNFEESAIVTFLFLFGAYLEQRTLNKTRSAIKELTEMAPESALKEMENGELETVDVDDVSKGNVLLVRTGAKVPVDGRVLSGEGHINEASITGESIPVGKEQGANVFAGTILENGTLRIEAERVGEDTTFGRIIEMVEDAQDSKSETELFINRFSTYYTPAVLLLAFVVWLFSSNIELAITVLVLGCPGALVIGVPVSNVSGIGNGARNGVLLKGSEIISDLSRVDTILFDKTGTLTMGNPSVGETIHYAGQRDETLRYLASVERESDHPLAKAILQEVGETEFLSVDQTDVIKGGGIVAEIEGRRVVVGNEMLMTQESVALSDKATADMQRLTANGNSIVMTAIDGELSLMMAVRDQLRPGVKEQLQRLRKLGAKQLVMLSGDNQATVDVVANELGLTKAYGNMLPEDKSDHVKRLKAEGHTVAFVGDGVNDSPSLALADIGIAMGSGTDVAIETSEVVLMNGDIGRLPHALGLAKAISKNMIQNIVIAVGVVFLLLGGLFFSDWVSMSVGMLVHEASILVVILNGMRLIGYKLRR